MTDGRRRQSTPFVARVLRVVCRIPPGFVATYGDVARAAGRPGAARAVGNIMASSSDQTVPYHRVVAAGGRLGGYGGREDVKRYLLEREGCSFTRGRLRDFATRRWSNTPVRRPKPRKRTL